MLIPVSVVAAGYPDPTSPPITTGLVASYDPSDVSTHTATGQAVTALADRSGGGFTLSVGSAVGEALAASRLQPQRLALAHRAIATWSSNATMSDISSSTFIVACMTYLGGAARLMLNPSATAAFQFYVGSSGLLTTDSAATLNLGTMTIGPTLGTPFVAASVLTTTSCRQYLNLTGETDTFGATSFTAGRTLQVGAASWCGWTGEILMYSDTKSDADAETIIRYLMQKWGVTG